MDNLPFKYSMPEFNPAGGPELTLQEMEKILLDQLAAAEDKPTQARGMWELAQFYKITGKTELAMARFKELLATVTDIETRAELVFSLGQTAEKMGDFALAANFYRHALAHEPIDKFLWYFVHNNLGYSLIQLGEFSEAERLCMAAIQIDPNRSNAHKNLGIALFHQGRYNDAAQCWVSATQADASDPRSMRLLENLLTKHPELSFDFGPLVEQCRKAVAAAAQAIAQSRSNKKKPE